MQRFHALSWFQERVHYFSKNHSNVNVRSQLWGDSVSVCVCCILRIPLAVHAYLLQCEC